MDVERPHFRNTSTASNASATSELFICFPSRLSSSSSMKLSRSIHSPGRAAREGSGPVTLTPSLSRRLRSNGSLKGGQASPFGKKRGCSFENPEPSSPKVTCIGQVRVKTKKKKKVKKQNRSVRRSGEVSFRTAEDSASACVHPQTEKFSSINGVECSANRNQRRVHLPVSICEALRGFGDEFTCLFPCKNSCFSASEREKTGSDPNENGCGSVFARWWVPVDDGEGGGRRDIELVVGGGEEPEMGSVRSSRRHVFEDIEVKDDRIEVRGRCVEEEEEEVGTMSICIPPKNALLLMRCRSDPMKMASLMNRFNLDAKQRNENEEIQEQNSYKTESHEPEVLIQEAAVVSEDEQGNKEMEELSAITEEGFAESTEKRAQEEEVNKVEIEEDAEATISSFEALLEQENTENSEDSSINGKEEGDNEEEVENEMEDEVETTEEEEERADTQASRDSALFVDDKEEQQAGNKHGDSDLLMMCEPKLSMEISKETWVCSTDFIRWLPERPRKQSKTTKDGGSGYEPMKKRLSIDSKPKLNNAHVLPADKSDTQRPQQPARSSCSLPAAVAAASMANMIEQKLVNGVGYEPFVLTRCKSEPMGTAAAKLLPELCFWKNSTRKLEPHRQAAMGVGAAGS